MGLSDFTLSLLLSVFYDVGFLSRGWTVVHFCGNQLSRDLIGLLPLNSDQRNQLHLSIHSVFHAPFEALQPVQAKIVAFLVLSL